MRQIFFLFMFSMLVSSGLTAQQSTEALLSGIKTRMDQVSGFTADALIKVDVEFIDIKDREVKIRFTAPDQFDFDAKGLALMPKNGMKMEYMDLINGANTAIPAGEEDIRGNLTQIIKIIPESIESDIILAQLWIDPSSYQILQMKTFTRASGSYLINFFYDHKNGILPIRLEVSFDIENMGIPAKMMNEFMGGDKAKNTDSLPKEAKVIVEYRNLVVKMK